MNAEESKLIVDFCGEVRDLAPGEELTIGRQADLQIDDNPFLHRRFLHFSQRDGLWWISNVGSQLTATVADRDGLFQAWLAPEARLPLVFNSTVVWFTAGPTAYEVLLDLDPPTYQTPAGVEPTDGASTVGRVSLTPDQKLLILALAEPALRHGRRGEVPSSAAAAERLGWTQTKFNRKLDNVCEKLSRQGAKGLHGSSDRLASSRRTRLVEYALATRIVIQDELPLLDQRED
ncbi:MAG TPA: hypothetical protein VHC43_03725 [Mycobacteriales bacterium]|nr:hypothetical protein [Mycobacteriales bacterium]